MNLRISNQSITAVATDAVIVNLFEGVATPAGATGAVDRALGGLTSEAISAGDITGKFGETHVARAAQFTVDGTMHGLFRFEGYRTQPDPAPKHVEEILVVEGAAPKLAAVEEGALAGRIVGESANWGRSLGMMPVNRLTATSLAEQAARMAAETGLECEVHDLEGCRKLGLGLLPAVNQGSPEEPRVIVLRHRGAGGKGPWLGLVGKGLTFDTGGISLKAAEGMWDMKFDMLGGAAVLAAMRAVALLKVKADVLAVVPSTDNMPNGAAFKPGDVIAGLSGKTVEIRSTDAEGRLILADGLAYAAAQGAAKLITAATLTGAVMIVTGEHRYATVANDDAWEREVAAAAEAGERAWPLPHDDEYNDYLKSPVADMVNNGPRLAGTIQAGMFLLKHVAKVPTVHMDIAGTGWRQETNDFEEKGATGIATRTLIKAAQRWAEGPEHGQG